MIELLKYECESNEPSNLKTLPVTFSEKDLSGGDKVCKTIPYIYVCVCARARTHGGLFFKIVKTENLAMLDRILPYEILNAISSFQHNNTAKSC